MYQSTSCARMAEESRGKYLCSWMALFFSPGMILMGVLFLGLLSDNGTHTGMIIAGVIMLLLGLGLLALGIALCYCMRKDASNRDAQQAHTIQHGQSLVSGIAPPGAIRGHFLQTQPQQHQYRERPSASAPDYPQNYHQAPPSYAVVTGKNLLSTSSSYLPELPPFSS